MHVHEIQLDLPARNSIDESFLEHFEDALAATDGGPILLRGTQQAFCAGLNLKRLAALEGSELEAFLLRSDRLFRSLWDHPGPVVACVEGHAIAGGCVLLQACDLRICADRPELRIGVNELALGACFPPNALRVVQARVPRQHVARVVLGADLFPPAEALTLGLVDVVLPDPLVAAGAECERLAAHPREAFAFIKRALRAGQVEPSERELARWRQLALPQWSSEELRSRIRAALER